MNWTWPEASFLYCRCTDALSRAISDAAHLRAQGCGFEPGHELEDWVAVEQDVIARHYPVDDRGPA